MTIHIKSSKMADTRSCDWSSVTKEQLYRQSKQHIEDVKKALDFFSQMLTVAGKLHDHTKVSEIDSFHQDFRNGFETVDWYNMHKKVERHHLEVPEGVRDDVNLIDVLEHVADGVMAGLGRSGEVRASKITDETLRKALDNTTELLAKMVVVGK